MQSVASTSAQPAAKPTGQAIVGGFIYLDNGTEYDSKNQGGRHEQQNY